MTLPAPFKEFPTLVLKSVVLNFPFLGLRLAKPHRRMWIFVRA